MRLRPNLKKAYSWGNCKSVLMWPRWLYFKNRKRSFKDSNQSGVQRSLWNHFKNLNNLLVTVLPMTAGYCFHDSTQGISAPTRSITEWLCSKRQEYRRPFGRFTTNLLFTIKAVWSQVKTFEFFRYICCVTLRMMRTICWSVNLSNTFTIYN